MKGDYYYLFLLFIFIFGEYFCVEYGISENILFIGLFLYGIYGLFFVDMNDFYRRK